MSSQLRDFPLLESKTSWYILIAPVVLLTLWRIIAASRPTSSLPIVSVKRKGFLQHLIPAKFFWIIDARNIVEKGTSDFSGKPFQVSTNTGYKVVLANRYADEIRGNDSTLSLNEALAKDFFPYYPGFEAFREGLVHDSLLQEVVRIKLTQSLGLITDDLVEETRDSIHDVLGESPDFHPVVIKSEVLDIVARLSTRVFLGRPLCRDKAWLEITKNYTVDCFKGAQLLRLCPALLRPLIYWVIPQCTRLRAQIRAANKLINSEVSQRQQRAEEALASGTKPRKTADAVSWVVECTKGRKPDHVASQLTLSMAAIHTTSETALNCILQLCDTPELIPALRTEIIAVLSKEGWSKQTLYKLRLMDSFLRETQRLRGMSVSSMARLVLKDLTLSDGTVLPAGTRIMVRDTKADNAEAFPNPEKFDAHRFLNMRSKEGEENRHQFVTLTNDHMAFGYGAHACPGRFFAANEIKILLCFLLLKYEFRHVKEVVAGEEKNGVKYINFELSRLTHPGCRIEIRRREEEIDLENPKVEEKKAEAEVDVEVK